MCTQPHPIAKEAYLQFLETNLGDPELFPGTKKIESKLLDFVKELVHAPKTSGGHIISGGTEGNITAIWIARQLNNKKEVLIPESAHFSFEKIASLMDIKLKMVPLTSEYVMDVSKLKTMISPKTTAVVGIAGSTELGTIDPIPEISDICQDEHLFFHVDAAFGGYMIPFLHDLGYDIPEFDFKLDGVGTIAIDAHKMGYSAIPLGLLIIRNRAWIEFVSVESPYISCNRHPGLLGTRSGGPVAAGYAVVQYLGKAGYKKVVKTCMEQTRYFCERIKDTGLKLVIEPPLNVIGVRIKKLEEVVSKLADLGWRVNKIKRLSCFRIVVMPQITKQIIDEFIPVLQMVCEEVGEV
jgi:tyrosine decarboxylase/aspartate 1-decarboxylase